MYLIENYKGATRYSTQRYEILKFLQIAADTSYNEHFHWGRFEWMMAHPDLNVEMLPKNALFRNEAGELVGVVVYDGNFDDRWYVLHSTSDENLLAHIIEYVTKIDVNAATIKANLNDIALCKLLENLDFKQQYSANILQMDLSRNLSFQSTILPVHWHDKIFRGQDLGQKRLLEFIKGGLSYATPCHLR